MDLVAFWLATLTDFAAELVEYREAVSYGYK
jgi:hypothetical protein